jgi:PAS domain S-box-containing protein
MTTDAQGRILEANATAAATFGLPLADLQGRPVGELVSSPSPDSATPFAHAQLNPASAAYLLDRSLQTVAKRADGTEFPAELTLKQLDIPGEAPIYAVYLRDLTDRKMAEAGLASMQVDLELRFAERAEALSKANLELEREIAEGRRREQLQNATYRISEAALISADLAALFVQVHDIIGELMPADNCYVALLNEERTLLTFPHYVDETNIRPPPRKPGRGLTEYLIDTGKPLMAT